MSLPRRVLDEAADCRYTRSMNQFNVRCKNCNGSNVVAIDEKSNRILWKEYDKIISGRLRLDGQWGWQCLCGNNSLLTKQEAESITDKANPDPLELHKVIQNLIPEKVTTFEMEKV